uniref:Xaa-Pro aminopeptidase ApepP (Trinotate prediction) n=1 Tax=Henneguya salminicola TaxID=69463 RepID=A0A6G3MGR8_HENSL
MLVSSAVMEHLNLSQKVGKEFAIIRPYLSITETIKDLAHNCARIWIDNSTPAFLVIDLPKNKLMIETNPINIQKAIKNETELQNLRKTCIRDAACLCEYFGYLEQNIVLTKITEVDGSNYLLSLRSLLGFRIKLEKCPISL